MKIAQISTVSAPVGPASWGSVEAHVWLLARELTKLGHEVTVFGIEGSETTGELAVTLPGPYGAPGSPDDWQLCEWINLGRAMEEAPRFDVLHSHAYLWGLPWHRVSAAPMAHTLHIVPDENSARLRELWPDACVTAVSHHQWSEYPQHPPSAVIPHGLDREQFTFREQPEDYVCYLGRFVSGKGPLHAIETARRLGLRLLLAGPENPYFREKIKPLVDGRNVEYVGCVRGADRDRLLGGARALLYPIQYPESFGLVLAEAMLCGTPVAATHLGAVPEVVDPEMTGCLAACMDEFPNAVRRALELNRRHIRQHAERRFSAETMAQGYLRVYQQLSKPSEGTP